MSANAGSTLVFIGTYTKTEPHVQGKAAGIYTYRLDSATGELTYVGTTTGTINPSFLALSPQQRHLYAVNETSEHDGQPGGAVSAFMIDPRSGTLAPINRQPSHGEAPCHLCVDATGRWVLVANYGTGSVAVYPIRPDGGLGAASHVVQHEGSSVNPQRQAGPHAHSITLSPDNRYAFVCDLGLDKVMIYRFDGSAGRLIPNDPPWVTTAPGAGPRHFDFHPSARYAYVINEIASTLTAFAYDPEHGKLSELQTVSTLPEGFNERNSTADVHVGPSGRFVYGSNRGHDSIAVFSIDSTTGRLALVGHEATRGRTPRNFAIDPSGTYLFAANQNSDTIVTFRIDPHTGALAATGHMVEVPTPVCIKFGRY